MALYHPARLDDELSVTDLFCGAGGSAIGARNAGFRVYMAANHSQLAIATHELNFPDTLHDCADISQVEPRRYRRTLVLWASPECTNHSQAKGQKRSEKRDDRTLFDDDDDRPMDKQLEERSRATMWDVVRFTEAHRYRYVIVENVVDVVEWDLFDAWIATMGAMGYRHQIVSLNSMHAPAQGGVRAPQSRDRVYVVFWAAGEREPDVIPRPEAWCDGCGETVRAVQVFKKAGARAGKYRQQYVYRCPNVGCRNQLVEPYAAPAAAAIDWEVPGQRIGSRAKPLSDKTVARIRAGLRKYAGRPVTMEAKGNTFVRTNSDGSLRGYTRSWPVDQPTATLTTSETRALVCPSGGTWNDEALSAGLPFRTRTTRETDALVVPVEGRAGESRAARATDPFRTLSTRAETALVVPYNRTGVPVEAYSGQVPTVTTVEGAGLAFMAELRGGGSHARAITDPLATVTASGNHHMLIHDERARRTLVQRHNGGGAEMLTPALEPMRTLTTGGHQSVVERPSGEFEVPDVDDCLFRMLLPDEIGRAMAFGSAADYKVLGTKREVVRQYGNGVTPPAAEFLLSAIRDAVAA